jgi:hypothetical protein
VPFADFAVHALAGHRAEVDRILDCHAALLSGGNNRGGERVLAGRSRLARNDETVVSSKSFTGSTTTTAKKLAPNIKVLFTTGYARAAVLHDKWLGEIHTRTPSSLAS